MSSVILALKTIIRSPSEKAVIYDENIADNFASILDIDDRYSRFYGNECWN